jgi:hypothetical protein
MIRAKLRGIWRGAAAFDALVDRVMLDEVLKWFNLVRVAALFMRVRVIEGRRRPFEVSKRVVVAINIDPYPDRAQIFQSGEWVGGVATHESDAGEKTSHPLLFLHERPGAFCYWIADSILAPVTDPCIA